MSRAGDAVNDDLPEPEELATDAIRELEEAVGESNAAPGLLDLEDFRRFPYTTAER